MDNFFPQIIPNIREQNKKKQTTKIKISLEAAFDIPMEKLKTSLAQKSIDKIVQVMPKIGTQK